ncbi:MAG: hypothetical protein HC828_03380 [Blastochloris sp.]|nr:hypothetical protein [Blastochloris sp.]
MNIDNILQELSRPFPLDAIQIRVGATNKEKTSGIALAYVHWWRGYLPVLNHYIGRTNYQIAVSGPKGDTIAHLSAFDGAVQAWSRGEEEAGEENQGTSSEIQAKRRVCAEGLGLGLYLYSMPKLWDDIEPQGRSFVFARKVEENLKWQMYSKLGLDKIEPLVVPRFSILIPPIQPTPPSNPRERKEPTREAQPREAQPGRNPSPERLNRARVALAEAEQRTQRQAPTRSAARSTPAEPVTIKGGKVMLTGAMAGEIVTLITDLQRHYDTLARKGIDAIGTSVGLFDLLTMQRSDFLNGKISRDEGAEILGSLRDLAERLNQRKAS